MHMLQRLEDQSARKINFMVMWQVSGICKTLIKWYDFNGHVRRRIDDFEGVHGGYGIGKRNIEGRRLLEICDKKELCVANIWFE